MSIFDDIIGKNADDRLAEEMLYAEAMREIEQGLRRDGLWGKAIADSEGDDKKAKGLYLKYRVQALKDELERERQKAYEQQQFAEEQRIEKKEKDTYGYSDLKKSELKQLQAEEAERSKKAQAFFLILLLGVPLVLLILAGIGSSLGIL